MIANLSILVSNNDALIGLGYTRIEVWQSVDDGNEYHEITAAIAEPAVVDSVSALNTFPMGGKTLSFILNGGAEHNITFSNTIQNWTPLQVSNRINEVLPGLTSVVGAKVRFTSGTLGRASSIEFTHSNSMYLGIPVGVTYGRDLRPTLSSGTLVYPFTDVSGLPSARYRWRFSANGSNPKSEFSAYVFGVAPPLIGAGNLSICSVSFVDLLGQPTKTKLLVTTEQNPTAVGNFVVVGPRLLELESNDLGFVQFALVRGSNVRIAIEGTDFVREFVVPNATSFNLLTAMAAAPDPFTVQTTPPFLIRRNI